MSLKVGTCIPSRIQLVLIVDQHAVPVQISNECVGFSVSHTAMSGWNDVMKDSGFVEGPTGKCTSAFLPRSQRQERGLISLIKLNPLAHSVSSKGPRTTATKAVPKSQQHHNY